MWTDETKTNTNCSSVRDRRRSVPFKRTLPGPHPTLEGGRPKVGLLHEGFALPAPSVVAEHKSSLRGDSFLGRA